MRRFLMHIKGLSEDEAIALMSAAVDFGVTSFGKHGRRPLRPRAQQTPSLLRLAALLASGTSILEGHF
jgi:hypothetical protein